MNEKNRSQQIMTKKSEQAALNTEGVQRPSIASIVLERMGKLSGISVLDQEKPSIKTVSTQALPNLEWPANWPECPPTCDKGEWRRSLENKEYYETAALKDDMKKPWFQYPKHSHQYSEFVYCTPDMMVELLKHMPVNRRLKSAWAGVIARDIQNERWLQTHESVAINTQGNMHDGQHRAHGIIKSGRGWPIYVTWNVPPEAIYVSDSGEKRKINEKLGLLFPDTKLNVRTAALCRSMMWGLNARGTRYSETEIAEFAVKHKQVILWVADKFPSGYRSDLQAVIGKALMWFGEEVIEPFVERLRTVQFTGEGDPAKTLYLWLQSAKKEGRQKAYAVPSVFYKKTLAAVLAHAQNKESKKLYQKTDDVFNWLPGWEVPAEAPCGGKVFKDAEDSEE